MDFDKEKSIIHFKESDNYDEIVTKSEIPVIVDFYADWCGPCLKLAPEIEKRLEKNKNFKLVKVNVDENPDLAEKNSVSGIPRVLLIKGGKQVADFTGYDIDGLDKMINIINEK
jgi:thioredoxin 1